MSVFVVFQQPVVMIYTASMSSTLQTKIRGSIERSFLMVFGPKNQKPIFCWYRKSSVYEDIQLPEDGYFNGGLLRRLSLFSKLSACIRIRDIFQFPRIIFGISWFNETKRCVFSRLSRATRPFLRRQRPGYLISAFSKTGSAQGDVGSAELD
jgi:hypothetical protein